jgi:hypothetical protein
MAWTDITAPSVGEATKKVAFADAVIGNLVYLKANMGGGGGDLIVNGDFELDSDSDGIPDGWDLTEYTAGAFDLDVTTPMQGAASAKFTSPGATGGGNLQSTDFFPVSEEKMLIVDFLMRSSVAGIHNLVEVRWYSTALEANYISTSTIYDSTTNPTSRKRFTYTTTPPATARFAKLKLVGAKNDTATAGIAYFDGVQASEWACIAQTLGDASVVPDFYAPLGTILITQNGDPFINVTGGTGEVAWRTLGICKTDIFANTPADGSMCLSDGLYGKSIFTMLSGAWVATYSTPAP